MNSTQASLNRSATYPQFTLGDALTQEQCGFFKENGFIHFKSFLDRQTVDAFLREIERIQAQWIEEKRETVNGVPIVYGKDVDGKLIVQRFAFSNQFSPLLADLLKQHRVQLLCDILGGEAQFRVSEKEKDGLVVNHYVSTEGSQWSQMGWHTDALRDVFYGHKVQPMLNIGVHLDDTTEHNGGLRVLPGTHKGGLSTMLFKKAYFLNRKADRDEVPVIVKAGDLTVHDGRIWHRAAAASANGETSRRRVMYFPIITGKVVEKNENSPTAFYHKLIRRRNSNMSKTFFG